MKHEVELAKSAGLKLSKQIARLDVVSILERRQVPPLTRVGGEIRDDDVRATAPVELPHQGAADKAGAAGYQNAALPPEILIFVDRGHGSNVTRIRRVFHPSARTD